MSEIEKEISKAVDNTKETARILANAKLSEYFDIEFSQGKMYNIIADYVDTGEVVGVMQLAVFFIEYEISGHLVFSFKKTQRDNAENYCFPTYGNNELRLRPNQIKTINPLPAYDLKVFTDKK